MLGEDVVRPAVKPGLGTSLLFLAARLRQVAKHAVREQTQLVVVVEDDAPMAGHSEVLEEKIPRKDVAGSEIAQGVPVIDDGSLGSGGFCLAQK